MQDLMVNGNTGSLTMSSREIEKLTGKRHADVLSDIRKMCESLNIQSTDFSADYKDSMGRTYPCFNLPKRETLILVSGYSVKMRAAIIDRWQELEQKETAALPDFTNPAAAARAWADALESKQAALVEADHYKAETTRLNSVCNDLAQNLKEGLTPVEFCRMLNGVNLNRIQRDLVDRKRLLKTDHGYRTPAAYRGELFIERRYFNKDGRICEKVVLTQKGAKWLYSEYEKGNLAMRKDWDGNYSNLLFENGEAA